MKELKEYLAPEIFIVEISDCVFTESKENNHTSDPYGEGDKWWEN